MRCLKLYMPVLHGIFFFFLFFHCDNYKCHSHKHGTNHHSPLIYRCHAQIACDSADGEHCVYAEKKQAFSQIVPVFMSDIFAYGRSRCSHIAYTHCGGAGVALRICASYAYFSECFYLCAAGKRNNAVAKDIKLIRYKCRRKECHRLEQNNYLPSVERSALEDMMHRLCKHNTCYKSHYRSKISEGDNKIAFCQIYRHKKNISRLGIGDMLDEVVKHFPETDSEAEEDDRPKIAIVGKPNVGKSSIINKLLGEERVIVSNIAGTTRDAIDTKVTWNKKDYIFIDTAGLRRKGKVKEEIERYSVIRTVTAVERADVVVVVIDASEGVTEQDAKIAGIAHDRGKGIIVAVNKWDAIEKNDKTIYKHTEKIRQILSFMPYAQIIFISAKTGQRLPKLFENIDTVIENQTLRIQTGVLNEILSEAVALQQPPSDRGRRLKIFYMTQVAVKPPTFVMFVNDKELTHFSYTRYIENKIREAFGFRGTALRFINRERKEKE